MKCLFTNKECKCNYTNCLNINNKIMIIKDGASDFIDERNYQYSEIAGTTILPDFILNDDWEIQDQYKAGYPMWCVYFSTSMNDNQLNQSDWISDRSKGWDLCDKSDTRSSTQWDLIINWPKLAKELKLIDWYFQLKNVSETMASLVNGLNIHCGSNTINWSETNKSPYIANISSGSWHCFHIIGYNKWNEVEYKWRKIPKDVFICKDSSFMFDNWFFYIRIEDFEKALFFTKLNFINNKEIILQYKKTIMDKMTLDSAKLFFLLWLTDGTNPQGNITREQAMAMNYRILEALVEWKITKENIEKAKEELKNIK